MLKREQKWQGIWNNYVRICNKKKVYFYYELKQSNKNYLNFKEIRQNQYDGLIALKNNGFVWKLSDQDQREKPCDGINTPPLPSYIVIKFEDGFYMIDIEKFIKEKEKGEASITIDRATQISYKIIKLST